MQYSKLIVSLVILLNVGFTAIVLFLFLRTGNEPTSLIVAWFAFTTGELWLLSGIKRAKVNKEVAVIPKAQKPAKAEGEMKKGQEMSV